jgi:hypothetical protein
MNNPSRALRSALTAGVAIALSCAATSSLADAPQAVTITTQIVFDPNSNGTFVATGPICSTGTVSLVNEVLAIGGFAFNVNATQEFVCDDNSGTFRLRLHPQGNLRPKDGFHLNGPWSVWGKGTGAYSGMAGHGEFGVVFVNDSDPLEGTETYVGFVTMN